MKSRTLVRSNFIFAVTLFFGMYTFASSAEASVIKSKTTSIKINAKTEDCGLGSSGMPCDATNTGLAGKGVTASDLTAMAAGATTGNGQLIYHKVINGNICIIHNNVIIRESQINGQILIGRGNSCGRSGDVNVTGTIIEDSNIDPNGGLEGINSINSISGIFRRNNITRTQNFITVWTGTGDQILSNFGHDETSDTAGQHYDGIEAYCWKNGLTIRNNTITQTVSTGATAPLNITPTGCSPTGQLLVEYNILRSANSAYVILIDNRQGGVVQDAVFNNNKLWRVPGGGYFAPLGGSNTAYSGNGNVDYVSGAAVAVP